MINVYLLVLKKRRIYKEKHCYLLFFCKNNVIETSFNFILSHQSFHKINHLFKSCTSHRSWMRLLSERKNEIFFYSINIYTHVLSFSLLSYITIQKSLFNTKNSTDNNRISKILMQLKYKFSTTFFIVLDCLFFFFIRVESRSHNTSIVYTKARSTAEIPHSYRSHLSSCLPAGTSCSALLQKVGCMVSSWEAILEGNSTRHSRAPSHWRREQVTHVVSITQSASSTYLVRTALLKLHVWYGETRNLFFSSVIRHDIFNTYMLILSLMSSRYIYISNINNWNMNQ